MMKIRAELPPPGAFNGLAAGSDEMRVLLPRFCFDRVIHPRRSDYCLGLEEGRQAESNGFIIRWEKRSRQVESRHYTLPKTRSSNLIPCPAEVLSHFLVNPRLSCLL